MTFKALLLVQFLALGNLDSGIGAFVLAVLDGDAQALDIGGNVREVVEAYLQARYGAAPSDLTKLRAAIARLP